VGGGGSVISPRRKVVFALVTTLVVALALEAGLHGIASINRRAATVLSVRAPETVPDPQTGTRPNPDLPDHDAHGWRNAVRPDRAEIVAIGDSQTYGAEVARENAWPQKLARIAGRPVYNLALGGYCPPIYWLLLEEALALEPTIVLVGLYAGNDLAEAYDRVYLRGLAPELRSHDRVLVNELEAADRERVPLGEAWRETKRARRGPVDFWFKEYLEEPLETYSRLYGFFHGLVRLGRGQRGGLRPDSVRNDWDKYTRAIAGADADLLFPFESDSVRTILTPKTRLAGVDIGDPRILEGLRLSIEALRRMNERCRRVCRLAVVLIPTKENVFSAQVRASGSVPPESYDHLAELETEVWEHMVAELDALGILWIDTVPALRAAIEAGRNPFLMDWNGHLGVLGNEIVARVVAEHPALGFDAGLGEYGSGAAVRGACWRRVRGSPPGQWKARKYTTASALTPKKPTGTAQRQVRSTRSPSSRRPD